MTVQKSARFMAIRKFGCLFAATILLAGCGGSSSSNQQQTSPVPTPTFSVAAGTYTTAQSVSISDTMAGVTIYYTNNGTTPTTSSSVYSAAITVSATETLEAIAVESGYTNSAVASAAYTIASTLPTPTLSVAAGTYTTAQSVSISDTMAGATIYYTTDGTTPTTSSSVYSAAITVNATQTLEAIAVESGYTNSAVASATYTFPELKGQVLGGLSNVAGAQVQLYAVSSTGYGSEATALLSPAITTDNDGNFVISVAEYTCPSNSTLTYLVATGGDPGVGTDNPAIALMTALGACGSLSSIGSVEINEVTTVASVWALAPFIGSGSAGAELGTSSTNMTGLVNAFANVDNLINISTGASPGTSAPTTAVIPTAKINTLANILAVCISSEGTTACSPLFTAATPTNGSAPTNTIDAALYLARNPSSSVATLFATTGAAPPFEPALSVAPPDWTLAVTYSGGGLDYPASIAVDSKGNVWTSNYCGSNSPCSSVTELSSTGQPISPSTGFTDGSLWESFGLAIDPGGNVWVTNQQTTSENSTWGGVSELNSSGEIISPAGGYFGGGVFFPVAVATDTNGIVWIANQGDDSASEFTESGSGLSYSGPFGAGRLPGPSAVAVDANHNAWFADQYASSGSTTSISADGSQVAEFTSGGYEPDGIATDAVGISSETSKGHVWIANHSTTDENTPGSVSELQLNNDGSVTVVSTGYTGGGVYRPNGIAVDGAGNVWVANFVGNTLTELQGANGATPGQALSPSTGLGGDANLREPYGIALDSSGNIWVSNFDASTITQFLGAAAPVKTPLAGPPQLP